MKESNNENRINETVDSKKKGSAGFEMSSEQAENISAELSKFHEDINHDQPIRIEDIDNLRKLAGNMKIDIGGEVVTVEEAEKIPDIKMNIEIWREMSEGKFTNTWKLTRITPSVSKYFQKQEIDINLDSLTSVAGLVLPEYIYGDLSIGKLTSAKGLVFPKRIRGILDLRNIVSADGLVLPRSVGKGLSLGGLKSAAGLVLPKRVGGSIDLRGLSHADKKEIVQTYPRYKHKIF